MFININYLGIRKARELLPKADSFLSAVIRKRAKCGRMDTVLTKYYREFTDCEKLSVHHLFLGLELQLASKINADFFCNTAQQICHQLHVIK